MKKWNRALGALVLTVALVGCGGGSDELAVEVPEGVSLCDVYTDTYQPILLSPIAFGEDGWEDQANELVAQAQLLEQLAPPEQADNAKANVGYFQAQADVVSASEFVAGSNEFNAYIGSTC